MPKKKPTSEKVSDIKRRIQSTERELRHLNAAQWTYSKRMLKFGVAAWIFGFATFVGSILIINAILLSSASNIWLPFIIIALAAPMFLTTALVRKFSLKIKQLERIRSGLLIEYEKAILKQVEHMVGAKG